MAGKRDTAPAAVRWTAYIAVAIVFAIACAFLSHWQLTKNAERGEQLHIIATNYHAAPAPLADILPARDTLHATQQWHPVTMTGRYLSADQLLVPNRIHNGTAAYEFIVPFRLQDGRIFLIDRGWEPPGNTHPTPDVMPRPPRGTVTVVARLMPSEPLPPNGAAAPRGMVPSINLPLTAKKLGVMDGARLDTGAFGDLMSETPAPPSRPHGFAAPSADPGPYLSYGIQWIMFAVMGFIFIWYVIRTERRVHQEEMEEQAEIAELAKVDPDAALQRAIESHLRRAREKLEARRDRDSAEEDELLDRVER